MLDIDTLTVTSVYHVRVCVRVYVSMHVRKLRFNTVDNCSILFDVIDTDNWVVLCNYILYYIIVYIGLVVLTDGL